VRNLGAGTFTRLPANEPRVVDIYPFFCTQQGEVKVLPNVTSPQLHNQRDILVYLPPSFVENPLPRHTHLLVLNDGQYTPWLSPTVGALVVGGLIEETLIVGVPSAVDRTYELTFSPCATCSACPGGDPDACNCSLINPPYTRTGGGTCILASLLFQFPWGFKALLSSLMH
jgi:hypothetical protein